MTSAGAGAGALSMFVIDEADDDMDGSSVGGGTVPITGSSRWRRGG